MPANPVLYVKTLADLLLLDPTDPANGCVIVLGRNRINDYGGDVFYADPVSTLTPDPGVVFQSATFPTGRFIRMQTRDLAAEMFGAYNDGTHPTETLAALQAASDYAMSTSVPSRNIEIKGCQYNIGTGPTGVVCSSYYGTPNWVGSGGGNSAGTTSVMFKPTTPAAAFTFAGAPGAITNTGIQGVQFQGNANTIAVECQAHCGGRFQISSCGPMKTLVLQHNKLANDFTEFTVPTLYSNGGLASAMELRVTSGTPSFNGCGMRGEVNYGAGGAPAILVGSTAYPYNGRIDGCFFPAAGAGPVVQNNSSTPFGTPWFSGQIDLEMQPGCSLSVGGGSDFFLMGGVGVLGSDGVRMGSCYTGSKIGSLVNGQKKVWFDPITFTGAITGALTTVSWPSNTKWNNWRVEAEVVGAGYEAYTSQDVEYIEGGGYNINNEVNNRMTDTVGYGNLKIGVFTSGVGLTLHSDNPFVPYDTSHSLRFKITMVQIGQGIDHAIPQ